MGNRIDDLEKNIADLMTQAGVDGPEKWLSSQGPSFLSFLKKFVQYVSCTDLEFGLHSSPVVSKTHQYLLRNFHLL